jgi:GNAT superfamily N-acetyltransferase
LLRYVLDFGDGVPAAILCLRDPWLRGPFLELLAVTVPGRGIGTALVAWLAERAGANLWTTVSGFNFAGRRFYRHQGFIEVARLPGLIQPGQDEFLLRRGQAESV